MEIKDITLSKENRDKFNIPVSGEVFIPGFVTDPDTGELCRITKLASDLFTLQDAAYNPYPCDVRLITVVVVPPTATTIESYCFANAQELTKAVLPDSIKEFGEGMFCSCSGLTSIKLPESLKEIPSGTFFGCHRLEKIEIPNSVKKIDHHAFVDCYKLGDIEVPAAVEDVDIAAFKGVQHINYHGNLPGAPWGAKSMN